jgi:hypothetical protein
MWPIASHFCRNFTTPSAWFRRDWKSAWLETPEFGD